ncbi:MAG TPA: hypothetical protein VGM54_23790 [Chthoniobacter sp.]
MQFGDRQTRGFRLSDHSSKRVDCREEWFRSRREFSAIDADAQAKADGFSRMSQREVIGMRESRSHGVAMWVDFTDEHVEAGDQGGGPLDAVPHCRRPLPLPDVDFVRKRSSTDGRTRATGE